MKELFGRNCFDQHAIDEGDVTEETTGAAVQTGIGDNVCIVKSDAQLIDQLGSLIGLTNLNDHPFDRLLPSLFSRILILSVNADHA